MGLVQFLHKRWFRLLLAGLFGIYLCESANAQLVVEGSLVLQGSASIQVAGNITLQGSVTGSGTLELNGEQQVLQGNAISLPKLKISNGTQVQLMASCTIQQLLEFGSGKLFLNDASLEMAPSANTLNASGNGYIVTNGLGSVVRQVTQPGIVQLPVGSTQNYFPISYTITSVNGTATVGVRFIDSIPANQSVLVEDRLSGYWKASIQNATVTQAQAGYTNNGIASGFATNLRPMIWQGSRWISPATSTIDTVSRVINFGAVEHGYQLAANNKFVWLSGRVFLQGAFLQGAGRMADNLRTPTNLIPLSDPYRQAPYNVSFSHFANSRREITTNAIFVDQPNTDNNVVDWVFLELRSTSGQLMGTRSALLSRSGRLIDIDGSNSIYFKNLDSAAYTLTVRHRNHLGLATDAVAAKTLTMLPPSNIQFDFTSMTDADLFGNTNAYVTSTDGFVLLRAGNANSNSNIRYSGPSNDNAYLLSTILGGVSTLILNNVYSAGDLNMNRNVRYSGPGNDNAFLLSTVLGGTTTLLISQQIPN